ncbi:MAG: class I SAM-dependent methyltransferase [Nitrospiraceae bacterium]
MDFSAFVESLRVRFTTRAVSWRQQWLRLPVVRHLRCLSLRRTAVPYPGRAAGTQVVRYYWSRFLDERRADIRGRALEIGVTGTVRHFGGRNVTSVEALDITRSSPSVTVVADLARADHLAPDQYDCFVNQFTSHIIYDFRAALYHSIRILKPGGVLLINFPCRSGYPVNGIPLGDGGCAYVYWWFTPRLVDSVCSEMGIDDAYRDVKAYGNFFALTAYMAGIPAEEMTADELDAVDPDVPVLICARIQKPLDWAPRYRPAV